MICIFCGYDTNGESVCPYCGKDLRTLNRIYLAADQFYNEGLEKAKVRDLTGAAHALNQSLKMNKYQILSRNLLGLVYFEMGEMVLALREWVISKNFQPDNNPADYYLNEMQRGQMEQLDQNAKKYNQAIEYCKAGDLDLAVIQLKRVLNKNPSMIRAHQLLALLYLMGGNPETAIKQLSSALKIDMNNPTTLTYMKEAKELVQEKKSHRKKKQQEESGLQARGDVYPTQKRGFVESIDSAKSSIVNIIVGIIVGVLVSVFLVLPTLQQNATDRTVSALLSANEEAAYTENDVATLRDEVANLEEQLAQYEGSSDVKDGYEALIEAQSSFLAEDWDAAASAFENVNRDVLDAKGQELYDFLALTIDSYRIDDAYTRAQELHEEGDLEGAITEMKKVVAIDEQHDEGNALYLLAEYYRENENNEEATETFRRVAQLYRDQSLGRSAIGQLEEMGADTNIEPLTEEEQMN